MGASESLSITKESKSPQSLHPIVVLVIPFSDLLKSVNSDKMIFHLACDFVGFLEEILEQHYSFSHQIKFFGKCNVPSNSHS